MYENIILDKHNLYYIHKKYNYIKINFDELKKLALSRHDHITFMKCDNDLVNKISSTAMETITFTVKEILTSDDWNVIYLPPKEEINLLEENQAFLSDERKENKNFYLSDILDKIIESLTNKFYEYKLFEKEINTK